MATNEQIALLALKKIDFDSEQSRNLLKRKYKLTRKNPFSTMSDNDWEKYVETRHPHFTSEPYYEKITWQELQQLELDAKAAGWELILRTTNNTAYCIGYVGQKWCQRTQWIFGLPDKQFLIHLTYNEDNWSLCEEEDVPLRNYFSLKSIATTKLKVREKTSDELADEYEYDYDDDYNHCRHYPSINPYTVEYYNLPNPPTGWVHNGGMSDNGTSDFRYEFVGPNAKYNKFLGIYTSSSSYSSLDEDDDDDKQKTRKEDENLLKTMIPASFWVEWIEHNKDEIQSGKFEKILITHWGDTYVLPGGQIRACVCVEEPISWDMDFQFIQQLMKTNINNWTNNFYGYECCGTIGHSYWNIKLLGFFDGNPELFKKTCIIEAKKSDDECDEWKPFNGYKDSIFEYKHIRLSTNARSLIEQSWNYIHSKN